MPLEIVMRATPSLSVSNGADFQILQGGAIRDTTAILIVGTARRNMVAFTATSASLTTGQGCLLRFDGGGTRFLELDAEL